MLTDNAKTFKAAAKEVATMYRSNNVKRYFANKGVSWEFITEKVPWHGGFWERLIKSTKRCLKKQIGRTSLTFKELRTILVEIEATLNNSPLTYIYLMNLMNLMNFTTHKTHYENNIRGKEVKRKPGGL